jgi:hypothetical protein
VTRAVLTFALCGLVLCVGLFTAWVQSRNFACAAELDVLQHESVWFQRCTSELREQIERFEFAPPSEETAPTDERVTRGEL